MGEGGRAALEGGWREGGRQGGKIFPELPPRDGGSRVPRGAGERGEGVGAENGEGVEGEDEEEGEGVKGGVEGAEAGSEKRVEAGVVALRVAALEQSSPDTG